MKRLVQFWTFTTVLVLGLGPLSAQDMDTDGDGFFDSAEDEIGTDKNDPLSRPFMEVYASPAININRPSSSDPIIAPPIVNAYRFGPSATGDQGLADFVSTPATFLKACDADFELALAPLVPNDLASQAEWHLETVLGESAAFINGLDAADNVASEDWLIGPAKSVPASETLSLTFDYFQEGSDTAGNGLRLLVSTDYAGGTPPDGTWTDITPAGLTNGPAGTWQRISGITIQGFEGPNVRLAFQYLSSGFSAGSAYRIGIDNICLHQNIFFPPEITSFTADGIEIVDSVTLTSNPELQVTANNLARVGFGEFAYRPVGATEWTTLGEDTRTANGLLAIWPIAGIADGDYELTARLWNGPNFTERTHTVTVTLDPPPSPTIIIPQTGLVTEATSRQFRISGDAGALIKLLRDGVEIESDFSAGSQLIYNVALPLGPSTFTATAENRAGVSAPSNAVMITRERRTPILGLTLNSTTVQEGMTVTGTLTIDETQTQDTSVSLSFSHPLEVNAGSPVIIPAGQLSVPVIFTGIQDNSLEAPVTVRITASAANATSAFRTVVRMDDDIPVLTLSVNRNMVSESDGASAAVATLTRDLSALGLTAEITNDMPTELTAPSRVSFAPGQDTVSFPLGAVDDPLIDGTKTASLAARVTSGATILSQSPAVAVEVTDNESPAIQLLVEEGYVLEGSSSMLRVERVGSATDQPLEVTLNGNNNAELVVPASVTIPANLSKVTVAVSSPVDANPDDTAVVLVTGTAADHSPGQIAVTVIDQTLADLVVRHPTAPAQVDSDQTFQVSYDVVNQGLLGTGTVFYQNVVLSLDPVRSADDIELTQVNSPSALDPGGTYGRSVTVQAPRETGTYYLLVTTDVTEVVEEISEANNTATLATTIDVLPAYTATVQATPSVVPVNNPVTFTGTAINSNSTPAVFSVVNIHIRVNNTERIIAAITNGAGTYSTIWTPLPGESGDYQVGAVHPGVATAPTQDTFSIITFDTDFPSDVLRLDESSGITPEGTIRNPTGINLTNISLTALNVPAGLTVELTLPGPHLAPGATWTVPINIDAGPGFSGNHVVTLRLTSDEGIELETNLFISVTLLFPNLVIDPSTLTCSVVAGSQKVVSFTIANMGGAASGPIEVVLPPLPWMKVASRSPLPSLGPDESTSVTVLLAPSTLEPLALNEGTVVVQPANGQGRIVPYAFRVVSDLKGDLKISVVDEFFYFTAAAPKVEDAKVTVRDAVTSEEVATFQTGVDGCATFVDLIEGWYNISVDGPDHSARTELIFVDAGELTEREFFISRNLVTFTWTVEEVEIEDTYTIQVVSVFETNVPAPVVTVTPGAIDVSDLTILGQTKVINLIIENHGLIATQTGGLSFGEHPFYEITPLIDTVGDLPAKSSLVVPITVRRVGIFGPGGEIISIDDAPGAPGLRPPNAGLPVPFVSCSISGGFAYSYVCGGRDVGKRVPIAVSGVSGRCSGGYTVSGGGGGTSGLGPISGGGGTGAGFPFGFGGGGGVGFKTFLPVFTPITFPTPTVCDCPTLGDTSLPISKKFNTKSMGDSLAAALISALPPWICVDSITATAGGGGRMFVCCEDGKFGIRGTDTATVNVVIHLSIKAPSEICIDPVPGWTSFVPTVTHSTVATAVVSGTMIAKMTKSCLGPAEVTYSGSLHLGTLPSVPLTGTVEGTPAGGGPIVTGTVTGSLSLTGEISATAAGSQFNQSGRAGEVEFTGQAEIRPVIGVVMAIGPGSIAGSCTLPGWSRAPTSTSFPSATFVRNDGVIIAEEIPELLGDQGVCAQVTIKIDQEAVMTRTAFCATLELGNQVDDDSLTEIGFDLDIRDLNDVPSNDKFNIQVTRLTGLNAIDGTGTIGPSATGSAKWTLIPRDTAAQTEDVIYTVGGTISYIQKGVEFSIPVEPVQITVRPDACLVLKYFHQREVFSDDPFTTQIEPAIPYALAVLVDNQGAGDARNLTITSAQPEIIENEKGLLIDFEIIASQVAGQPASPSLAADFGTIAGGESKVATWFLISTLQGRFVDYEATFEHTSSLGDPRISLLKDVEIHEMIHMIQALGAKDDGLPDFLVNDLGDFNNYPDTVHFSDGGTALLTAHETATATTTPLGGGSLQVDLTTSQGPGWSYLRVPDPSSGMILVSAVRSDGRDLMVPVNCWTTDRTFGQFGTRPTYEDTLHLVDCDSTGSYTLIFGPPPGADLTPPTSAINVLSAQSSVNIPLFWSGADNESGVASFDIFYRQDAGPWLLHLAGTNRTSSIFSAQLGSNYEFYSVARDAAGNEEAPPPGPDTVTEVTVQNLPPILTDVPDLSVNEGDIFLYQLQATDPDGPDQDIIYSITQGPPGIQIDPFTGALDFVTGEVDSSTSFQVEVVAADSGIPTETDTDTFQLSISKTNQSPVFDPIPPQTIEVGEPLVLTVNAVDADLPSQMLRYSLDTAPTGMSIDPESGLIVWAPDETDADTTVGVRVLVMDDQVPAGLGSGTFSIKIPALPIGPPVFMPSLTPRLLTGPGVKQLVITAADPDGDSVTISADLSALPESPSFFGALGAGTGTLTWDLTDVSPGVYSMPVLATTIGGEITNGILLIRVETSNDYWEWAGDALFGVTDPGDYGMFSNPDNDNEINIFEMIFLMNPILYDQIVTTYSYGGLLDPDTGLYLLDFTQSAAAPQFATISFEQFVNDAWQTIDPGDFTTVFDPNGDLDGDPSTLDVQYQFTGPAPQFDATEFFQLSAELLPGIGP